MSDQLELLISKEFISSREDSHALKQVYRGRLSGTKLGWMGNTLPFGGKCCEFVASYCQSSSSWKTPQGSLLTPLASDKSSVVFPISGIMRDMTCYRVQPAVPRTLGLEFLSLHKESFPTLTARDYRSGKGWKPTGHTPQLPEVLGGLVNPTWAEWLAGFPTGWTECDASETP